MVSSFVLNLSCCFTTAKGTCQQSSSNSLRKPHNWKSRGLESFKCPNDTDVWTTCWRSSDQNFLVSCITIKCYNIKNVSKMFQEGTVLSLLFIFKEKLHIMAKPMYKLTRNFNILMNNNNAIKWKSLSCVWLLRPMDYRIPWNSSGQNSGEGSHSLLQEIFPTQGSNTGLLHCRWILYQLSHQESPTMP